MLGIIRVIVILDSQVHLCKDSNQGLCATLGSCGTECDICMDFDTNEYLNIFVSRKLYERISEYIRMNIFDMNEYLNIFVLKFRYERISE